MAVTVGVIVFVTLSAIVTDVGAIMSYCGCYHDLTVGVILVVIESSAMTNCNAIMTATVDDIMPYCRYCRY